MVPNKLRFQIQPYAFMSHISVIVYKLLSLFIDGEITNLTKYFSRILQYDFYDSEKKKYSQKSLKIDKKEKCTFPSRFSPITEKNIISVENLEDFPRCPLLKEALKINTSMRHCRIGSDRRQPNYLEKNPVPVTLKPPPVPDGLAHVASLASELKRRRYEDWNSSKLSTYKNSVPTSQKNSSSPFG
jgi:hypothetical protein